MVIEGLKLSLASALGRTRGKSEVILARTVDRGDLVEVDVDADLVNDAASDIVTATVRTPEGAVLGFIHNPHFDLA